MNVSPKILRAAYKAALFSSEDEFRHGAVVYKGRRLIASGFNDSSKTHPRGCGHNNSHHAEFSAILRAKRVRSNLRGCSIFVVRINRRGEIRFSKPCSDCWAHIENEGLKPFWSEHDDGLCRQNWA